MNEMIEAQNLAQLFQAITNAGNFGLSVLGCSDASELARADASAVVDLASRKLHELLRAFDDEDEE